MLVVSLRSVNFGFWSHLGCSGQNADQSHQLGFLLICALFAIFVCLFTVSSISTTVLNTFDTQIKFFFFFLQNKHTTFAENGENLIRAHPASNKRPLSRSKNLISAQGG